MNFKHLIVALAAALLCAGAVAQEHGFETSKRELRRNMTVNEWNTDAKTKTRWLDHVTRYDENGRKVEEIEYAQYGQKWRATYEYGDNDKIAKEIEFDDRDQPVMVRKYEYDSMGRKSKQYNYLPNGKLKTVKVFEYITN